MDLNPYEPPAFHVRSSRRARAPLAIQSVRAFVAVAGLVLGCYWALFAISSFPLIVPADHNPQYVEAYTNASYAGVILAMISGGVAALNIVMAMVRLPTAGARWVVALVMLFVVAGVSPWLYPALKGMQLSSWRLAAHVWLAIIMVLSAALPEFEQAIPAK